MESIPVGCSPVKPECDEEVEMLENALGMLPGPEYVSSRPGQGGKMIYYVDKEQSMMLANEVFGHSGWSSEVRSHNLDQLEPSGRGGFIAYATAVVRVNCHCSKCLSRPVRMYHEAIGYGQSEQKTKDDAIGNAKKGAETDARKRALRLFGRVFGDFASNKNEVQEIMRQQRQREEYQFFRKSSVPPLCRTGSEVPVLKHPQQGRSEGLNGLKMARSAVVNGKRGHMRVETPERDYLHQVVAMDDEDGYN